jgi:hypothetical protein
MMADDVRARPGASRSTLIVSPILGEALRAQGIWCSFNRLGEGATAALKSRACWDARMWPAT